MFTQGFACQATCQNAIQFSVAGLCEQHHIQRVVGNFAAVRRKRIQTFGQRALQIGKAANVGVRHFTQFCHVIVEGRLLNIEGFIRTPAWQNFHGEAAVFCDRCVMLQRIDRIVSRADHFHVHLLHDAACGEFILRQQFVALIPDFVRRRRRKQLTCHAEWATQFKVRPVV
ncbi:hypothetical protein SDC9_147717 [bioreactor metagenome]|uniref:Uncharacterized protein n=1 Tax=bioreactor metagenome TaxID=1076179 RepID=A0A645EGW5_9ZZZZ